VLQSVLYYSASYLLHQDLPRLILTVGVVQEVVIKHSGQLLEVEMHMVNLRVAQGKCRFTG
jgi:hypothetical protein